ncbi:hypothetical protein DEO72_LG2g2244 [Vigna unguiculata]|uniref:GRF-type domain-containing protein n=1 Tax=Vigna unguiculata TaxID=3917 RepID=A0A4D6KYN0_VIGUN|nr:hypothetical protein DEO72_LG2g2244 [Vigna unguiculata]
MCYCGEVAVLRVTKTIRNVGKEFWGCTNFKRSGGNDVFKGCNYFKWLNEDNGDKKMLPLLDKGERYTIWKSHL